MEYDDENQGKMKEYGEISSSEEAFMQGYMDEGDMEECDECGERIRDEKFSKEVDGEMHHFCSKICVKEFEEGMN